MTQIINQLAEIEVSNEVLQQLDVAGIYQSFSANYRKLDDLKNFRSEYEKKNRLMRWWHNDKLRDAQLDSAEVQSEFSKTIGQLMMISIMQSKRLAEQQTQLNEQQGRLKAQADGIAEHAGELQRQHQVLAEQSAKLQDQADGIAEHTDELQKQHQVLSEQSRKLENLVHEYFALKGLTEEGAQKLVDIARDVKATKSEMLHEFDVRSKGVDALCADVSSGMATLSMQVGEQIRASAQLTHAELASVQRETREALETSEASLHAHTKASQDALNEGMDRLAESLHVTKADLQERQDQLSKDVESLSADVFANIATASSQLEEQMRLDAKHTETAIAGVKRETKEALLSHEKGLQALREATQSALNQSMEMLTRSLREIEGKLQSKHSTLESRVSDLNEKHDQQLFGHREKLGLIDAAVEVLSSRSSELATAISGTKAGLANSVEQQQTHQDVMTAFQQKVSKSLKSLRYAAAGLSVVSLGLVGALAHFMKLI